MSMLWFGSGSSRRRGPVPLLSVLVVLLWRSAVASTSDASSGTVSLLWGF